MYRLEKDNVVRYAATEKEKNKLLALGYSETAAGESAAKKVAKNGADKA